MKATFHDSYHIGSRLAAHCNNKPVDMYSMEVECNYFADDTEPGVTSPITPSFPGCGIPPWWPRDTHSSPRARAEDAEDYATGGEGLFWSAAGQPVNSSPVTPSSSLSACIPPTAMSLEQHEACSQWSPGEWKSALQEDELCLSSGSDASAPPIKKRRGKVARQGSKSAPKPAAVVAPTGAPDRVGQLRTASRKAKRTSAHKPAASEEERRARASHNLVEKQYRNRLNAQFERLLAVLPLSGSDDDECAGEDRRLSKAEVLDIARRRIKSLEKERDSLRAERDELSASVRKMRDAVVRQRAALAG